MGLPCIVDMHDVWYALNETVYVRIYQIWVDMKILEMDGKTNRVTEIW